MEYRVTPQIEVLARSLCDQKGAADLRPFVAEAALLSAYSRDELGDVSVVNQYSWPMRIHSSLLDADTFVFMSAYPRLVRVHGWLPVGVVEEAPVWWLEQQGVRVDYAHEVDQGVLYPMPKEFVFPVACSHENAIWDYDLVAWECCGCRRFFYSREDTTIIEGQDARFGWGRGARTEGEAGMVR